MKTLQLFCLILLISLCFKAVYCSSLFFGNEFDDDVSPIDDEDDVPPRKNTTFAKKQTITNHVPSDVDRIKIKLEKATEMIFDEINNDTKRYKALRDAAIKDNKKKQENDKRPILKTLDSLQKKRIKIENIISKIQDGVRDEYIDGFDQIKEQCRNKLKILSDRKMSIIRNQEDEFDGFRVDEDDEEDFFRDAPYSHYELNELNAEIKEVENNLANLNYGKHGKLNFVYSHLVEVYKEEISELKKKSKLDLENKIESISNIYTKNIESMLSRVKTSVENLIKDAYNFIVPSKPYKWINFNHTIKTIPDDAILGGTDIDKTPLYVIRGYLEGFIRYGKYAFNVSRRDAYLTNGTKEFLKTDAFELLTAKNVTWCDSVLNKGDHEFLPICRVIRNDTIIPGTLLENDSCMVGFGWSTHTYSKFEVLSLKPCILPETTTTTQFSFLNNYQDFDEEDELAIFH